MGTMVRMYILSEPYVLVTKTSFVSLGDEDV